MGRKPNPLILEFFQRGPKLADNSNRYPHTCKLCGEDFPKGRIDSLTGHITKSGKCPAISETERINACLTLHGIPSVPPVAERLSTGVTAHNAVDVASATDTILAQQWSALEALAEASRQVDMSEKHDRPGSALVHVQLSNGDSSGMGNMSGNGLQGADRFDLPDQFTLDNPPSSYDATTAAMAQQSLNSLLPPEFHPDPTSGSPSHSLLTTNTHDTDSTAHAVSNGISKPHSPITESLATKDQRDELKNDDQQRQSQELKGNQNNEQHEHHYSHDDLPRKPHTPCRRYMTIMRRRQPTEHRWLKSLTNHTLHTLHKKPFNRLLSKLRLKLKLMLTPKFKLKLRHMLMLLLQSQLQL
ncbi:hypothetical protein CFO_g40 [Ceratocystis platani]|uniref:Uncharacterized protein n=1 Tax=Ceratocystis fimbriata f. sp. platani TaxID=88771 RepID=A0A0F8D4M5_CERFI|nr:hypothetical protein CFO_g40 [Ceratocystis platani]